MGQPEEHRHREGGTTETNVQPSADENIDKTDARQHAATGRRLRDKWVTRFTLRIWYDDIIS